MYTGLHFDLEQIATTPRELNSQQNRFIPNTAVFGPTNFIETTTATTTRMKKLDEKVSADEKGRFLNLDF